MYHPKAMSFNCYYLMKELTLEKAAAITAEHFFIKEKIPVSSRFGFK